jgi:hypothetical protein
MTFLLSVHYRLFACFPPAIISVPGETFGSWSQCKLNQGVIVLIVRIVEGEINTWWEGWDVVHVVNKKMQKGTLQGRSNYKVSTIDQRS